MPVNALDVFVNCPFDDGYKPIFNAIVYTVVRSGYRVRCALETDDAGDNRLDKICKIIGECRLGIHDISRTEADGEPPLPRFNMPFELGLFLGARRYGGKAHKAKSCLVFDRDKFRFQRFISDIAGQDIHAHNLAVPVLIRELATWMRLQPGPNPSGGGEAIAEEYRIFESSLPQICARQHMQVSELSFADFNTIVTQYVAVLAASQAESAKRPSPG